MAELASWGRGGRLHTLADGRAATATSGAHTESGGAPALQRNILIIERIAGASQQCAAMLRDHGQQVEIGGTKEEAFNRLFEAGDAIDVVLLDASLTEPNVITFAREFRRVLIAHCFPVIRLAKGRDDESEAIGIRAGIWHYLAVPCAHELLLALIEAVAKRRSEHLRLRAASEHDTPLLTNLVDGTFRFRTLEDVERIAQLVAGMCPSPDRVVIGLAELMLNAVEHGNLGIGFEAKWRINAQGVWFDEIRRRLEAPEQSNRFATLTFKREDSGASIRIEDCGAGFDWKPYLEFDSSQACDSHGRGIAVARMLSFDAVAYAGRGNIVTAVIKDPSVSA